VSSPASPCDDPLSLEALQRLDVPCQRFEAAWQAGQRPDLEAYLGEAREEDCPALLRELLALELDYRRRAGEAARAEDYLARYPELADDPVWAARLRAADAGAGRPASRLTTRQSTGGVGGQPATAGPADPAGVPALPGYEVLAELGRGGMGVVYRGRDPALNREVAVKVLRPPRRPGDDLGRRFVEEAQVTSQLQHPGIPPVHELSTLADGRPYFVMKVVKGRTLADRLRERGDPAAELPQLLTVFEQVCQALAYAHSKRVIHRDLKPSNIMVGAFGEVQVMDWGLAKVLPEGGGADPAGGPESERRDTVSLVRTQRGQGAATPEDVGAYTQEGDVLGTPAYMAPEQARGDVELVDERADVFGLGAMLCELLTGQPPFTGNTAEALRKARTAHLDDALARLDGCGADAELVALAKGCLAAEPWDRPRHAGAVAEAVTAYRQAVAERLRQAELAGAEAQARAQEERKTRAEAEARLAAERRARQLTVGLAAAVLLGTLGLGGGGLWLQQRRAGRAAETERDYQAAVQEAAAQAAQARELHDDPPRWQAALATALSAAKRAEGVLRAGVATEEQLAQVRAVRGRLEQQEHDCQLAAELEEIRLLRAETRDGHFDWGATVPRYAAAFARYGLDVAAREPAELAGKVREHPLREQLLAALRDWARLSEQAGERQQLAAVMAAVEPALTDRDRQWQAAYRARDRAALERLADGADLARLPAATLVQLALDLDALGAPAAAARLLRRGQPRYPSDLWLNHNLGMLLREAQPPEPAAAVRYLTAALAVRPRSPGVHLNLGNALHDQKDLVGAVAAYREAIRLDPKYAMAHNSLGIALHDQKDLAGAVAAYREAIRLDPKYAKAHNNLGNALRDQGDVAGAVAAYQEAIRRDPKNAPAHNNLGIALHAQGDLSGAVAAYQEAIRLDPKHAKAHNNLGIALREQGDVAGAVAAYRVAIRLDPKYAWAHHNLGNALRDQGDVAGAVAAYRVAIRLEPKFARAHLNLGVALQEQGDVAGAVAAYQEALRLDPKYAKAHHSLGNALADQKDLVGAVAAYQEALRLDLKYAGAHYSLGNALYAQKDLTGAVAAYREAIRLDPKFAWAHINLGVALREQGDVAGAVAAYRVAIRLDPENAKAHYNLGNFLRNQGDLSGAVAAYREALRLDPKDAGAHYSLGNALHDQKDLVGAAAAFREAIRLDPKDAGAHFNLGNALRDQGNVAGAVAAYRAAIRLDPKDAGAHFNLGRALRDQGDLSGAVAAYREAIRLDPRDAKAHNNLGNALRDQGDRAGAVAAFRAAIRLDPKLARAHTNLGNALRAQGDLAGAVAAFRQVLRLEPKHAKAHNNLGTALQDQGDLSGAVAAYREALRLDPKDAMAHYNLGRALHAQKDLAGAVAAYREAIRRDPRDAPAHNNLGTALHDQGDVAGAVVAYRAAIRLDPKYARAHYNLGNALREQGDRAGAVAAYREAIRHDPKHARAHCNLGQALREQGEFASALESLRRGHELGTQQPGWRYPSAQWVSDAERLLGLEAQLPAVLGGTMAPADAAQRLDYARVCRFTRRYAAAARLYAEAFAADAKLAENLKADHRYNAACSAALAASPVTDPKILPDKAALGLRRQALVWLRADLALYAKLADRDDPAARQTVQRKMRHWQKDADLASVRTRDALDQLPDDERTAWRQLWEDVEQLRRKVAARN
jgi:tetratricopeptide (TPR) repeat protein